MSFAMSMSKTVGFRMVGNVGFANYAELFRDPRFAIAFSNTFAYLGWSLLIGYFIPVVIGLFLSEVIHFKSLFRIGIYFPAAIAGLIISILFSYLFDPSSAGFLNYILKGLGLSPLKWLDDPNLSKPLIVITMTWRGAGSTALIYLSAFQQIDKTYYEASRIDGANAFNRIIHITLPNVLPTMSLLFMLQIISVMQVFFEPFVMTKGGGPVNSSLSLLLLAYNLAFNESRSDLSAACTVILFLIIMGLSGIYFGLVAFLKKRGYKV